MKKIVIACDSFKESMSAMAACQAIERGLKQGFKEEIETTLIPMADGGEGTIDVLKTAIAGEYRYYQVANHMNVMTEVEYVLKDDLAVIESAKVIGLDLIAPEQRDPTVATSLGLGLLLEEVINNGAKKIIVGLGGSGTNDGGLGMLMGMGAKVYDNQGVELTCEIASIKKIAKIDLEPAQKKVAGVEIIIANDVDNPYIGTNGATRIFGKQKGSSPQQLDYLESCLVHLNGVIKDEMDIDLGSVAKTGAAGGLGGAFYLLGSKMQKGIDLVLEMTRFEERIQGAAYVFTGEGSIDSQTINGKTISGIAKMTSAADIPLIGMAGKVDFDIDNLYEIGLTAAFSITNQPKTLEEALKQGEISLEMASKNIARILDL